MYIAEINQDAAGNLSPIEGTLKFIDQNKEWGGWVHCAGSVTPWNTYLGGEEYEPDAKKIEKDPTSDYCGAIYAMDVMSGVRDTNGKKIRSDFVTINMNSILASGTEAGEVSPDECALNNDIMAQPDNITMIENSDSLIIGEDGKHYNNMARSFDLDTHELTRIATVPVGAETTSPYIYEVGDASYMTLVAQHPDSSADNPNGDSITGVVGPMTLGEYESEEDDE